MKNLVTVKLTKDEIKAVLEEKGFEGTEDQVKAVVKSGNFAYLKEYVKEQMFDFVCNEVDKLQMAGTLSKDSDTDALIASGFRCAMCQDCCHYDDEIVADGYCSSYEGKTSPYECSKDCSHFMPFDTDEMYSVRYNDPADPFTVDTNIVAVKETDRVDVEKLAKTLCSITGETGDYDLICSDEEYDSSLWEIVPIA